MRYQVVMNQDAKPRGFSIWDQKLSPLAVEEDVRPFFCSLDGKNELVFPSMGKAYQWLARCEQAGLDLEADAGNMARVYVGSDGTAHELYLNRAAGQGPVIRELPALWRED